MNWWHMRKGRNVLRKIGYTEADIKGLEDYMKQGYRTATEVRDELRKYEARENQLTATLNSIRHGTAPAESKIAISRQLIEQADLLPEQKHGLLEQLEKVYNSPDNER